jgi:hypothetical protein
VESHGYIPEAERNVCGERAYRRFTPDQVKVIREIKEYSLWHTRMIMNHYYRYILATDDGYRLEKPGILLELGELNVEVIEKIEK